MKICPVKEVLMKILHCKGGFDENFVFDENFLKAVQHIKSLMFCPPIWITAQKDLKLLSDTCITTIEVKKGKLHFMPFCHHTWKGVIVLSDFFVSESSVKKL